MLSSSQSITNYCRNGETAVRQRPCGSGYVGPVGADTQ